LNTKRGKTPITLTDWQELFWERKGSRLIEHSSGDICLRLVEASGYIAEAVRRNRFFLVIDELGAGLGRLLDTYNRVAYDEGCEHLFRISSDGFKGLEASVFNKFPRRCFLCGKAHCECNILFADTDERTDDDERKALQQASEALRLARLSEIPPKSLDEYEDMFARIYGQGHRYSNIDSINHHLMEEIGEIARAHRHLKESINNGFAFDEQKQQRISPEDCRQDFCSEIADVLSWVAALRRKAEYHIVRAIRDGEIPEVPKLSQSLATFLNNNPL
jgi:NTP pyrophosphatase (non-canonical NTP hydrolase)